MSSIGNPMSTSVSEPTLDKYPLGSIPTKRASLASQQRVVLLCSTFWSIRNVVHSGLLEHLKSRGVKAFLLVGQSGGRPLLDTATAAEDVSTLLPATIVKSQWGKTMLDELLNASFAQRYQSPSYPIFSGWHRRNERGWLRLRSAGIERLSRIGCRDFFYYWQINNLERFLRRTRDYRSIREPLKALRPALVISTHCTQAAESPYVQAAQDLGIATLNWVLGFDNLTSRGRLPVFDHYAVWNQRMKEQVVRLYPECEPESIHVTGTSQFDFHISPELQWDRESTLLRLDLNRNDRYLLYSGNCSELTPSEPKLIEQFSSRCADSTLLKSHRIVVRLHPLDDYSRWQQFDDRSSRVVISRPWTQDADVSCIEDQAFLVNTLRHADACINMASTMSLDAAVVDTPVVCVAVP